MGKIRLAGAFGSHIDVKYAMILGLIPDCDLAKVQSAGNAAGTGARIALLNMQARATRSSRWCAGSRRSRRRWNPCSSSISWKPWRIPHKTAPFPHLAKAVQLPATKEIIATGEDGGERRRRRRG